MSRAALQRVSRAVRWPDVLRAAVTARLTARHYLDAVLPQPGPVARLRLMRRWAADRRAYAALPGAEPLRRYDDDPQLSDWVGTTPYDPHYLHQDAWAAREIFRTRPDRHVDVGSRVSFVAGVAAFTPVTFVDIRPLDADVPNLESVAGSLLDLPFASASLASVSCLHVVEHVGLGRYGDPLDPEGTSRAIAELARVVAPGGVLLLGLPVGRPRTNFNAHRVTDPEAVPAMAAGLRLDAFAAVDDDGRFRPDARPADLADADWSAGLYRLVRD